MLSFMWLAVSLVTYKRRAGKRWRKLLSVVDAERRQMAISSIHIKLEKMAAETNSSIISELVQSLNTSLQLNTIHYNFNEETEPAEVTLR